MKNTSDNPLTFQDPGPLAVAFGLFVILIVCLLFALAIVTIVHGSVGITFNEINKIFGLIIIGTLSMIVLGLFARPLRRIIFNPTTISVLRKPRWKPGNSW